MASPTTAPRDKNRVPTLLAVSDIDFATPVAVAANPTTGALDIEGTVTATITGVATSANQTNGNQKTQIVDGSGNVIASTANALDINISSFSAGLFGDPLPVFTTADGIIGNPVPGSASFLGIQDSSGDLRGVYSANTAWNAFAGTNGQNVLASAIFTGNGSDGWFEVDDFNPAGAGDGVGSKNGMFIGNANYVWNGASFDKVRTPAIFKTATATASGNTTVWTPTSGKKFRLMRFLLALTANVNRSAGGVVEITFQDATTDMGLGFSVFVPTTAVTTTEGGYTSGWIDLGNGILSAGANNVLHINLSAALSTGECRVSVCGTEE